jgi:hypothetical protein
MAVLKRAMRYAMKPSGMLIFSGGVLLSAFIPKVSVAVAKMLVSTFKISAITDAWYTISFDMDDTVATMQETTGA